MVRSRGLVGRVLLQSFDEQVLRDAYAIEPSLRLGLLRGSIDADPVAVARGLHAVAYNPDWNALVRAPLGRRRPERRGHRRDAVHDRQPGRGLQARDAGVDGIITNKPGELWGWNSAAGRAPRSVAPATGSKLTAR